MIAKIGKYTIIEQIGKGSMGIVYKARDPEIGRVVAIKTIHLPEGSAAEQQELILRLKQEARAAGSLNHPNIVVIYEYGEDHGAPYIAMAYVDGRELKSYIEGGQRFSVENICSIMAQTLDALDYSHRNNIVHRDIKPANIMLMADLHVMITDFGIARLESSELTQLGSTMGTPAYMSPEQCLGRPVDGRSDIFSAGIILYQLLTGEKPFAGPSNASIIQKIVSKEEQPPPPTELNGSIPEGFDAIIAKCLAKNPADRFASAAECAAAIQAVADAQPAGSVADHTDDSSAQEIDATVVLPGEEKSILQDKDAGEHEHDPLENENEGTIMLSGLESLESDSSGVSFSGRCNDAEKGEFIASASRENEPKNKGTFLLDSSWRKKRFVLTALILSSVLLAIFFIMHWGHNQHAPGGNTRPTETDKPTQTGQSLNTTAEDNRETTQPPASERSDKQINALLEEAQEHIKNFRVTVPKGNNAVETLRKVLQIAPENRAANEMLQNIVAGYASLGEGALGENNIRKANLLYEQGKKIADEFHLPMDKLDTLSDHIAEKQPTTPKEAISPGSVKPSPDSAPVTSFLALQTAVIYQAHNGSDTVLQPGATLQSGDKYKIIIVPEQECYLYLLQKDSAGGLFPIFPRMEENEGLANPLQKGRQYEIPGWGRYFYLDEQTGRESIFFYAADKPDQTMEEDVRLLNSKTASKKEQKKAEKELLRYLSTKKTVGATQPGKVVTLKGKDGAYTSRLSKIPKLDKNLFYLFSFNHE